MDKWLFYNKIWIVVLLGFFILYAALLLIGRRSGLVVWLKRKVIRIHLAILAAVILFFGGWAVGRTISFFELPPYALRDYRSSHSFSDIVELVKSEDVDITKDNKNDLDVFYTSDEPFLLEVEGFKGILFCPASPKESGFVSLVPLKQLNVKSSPNVRLHGILKTNADIIVGSRKHMTIESSNQNPKRPKPSDDSSSF